MEIGDRYTIAGVYPKRSRWVRLLERLGLRKPPTNLQVWQIVDKV